MYIKDHGKDVLICDQAIQMSHDPLLFMNYELWFAILVCVTVFVLCVVFEMSKLVYLTPILLLLVAYFRPNQTQNCART